MGNNSGEEMQREMAANSEVEIYLDKKVLDLVTDEYEKLKVALLDWAEKTGNYIIATQDSSAGKTTASFSCTGDRYLTGEFADLVGKTDLAIKTMIATSYTANTLLLRCENFCEIIEGKEAFSGVVLPIAGVSSIMTRTPMSSELYLDLSYYGDGGGILSIDTEDACLRFKNIQDKNKTVISYLSKLEYEQIDYEQYCDDIEEDCQKKDRLTRLYDSFVEYVNGISNLNTYAAENFNSIFLWQYCLDYSRTYSYDGYKTEDQNIALQMALKAELHEMGLTDEEIENATTKSSFTLSTLAAYTEKIWAEDNYLYNHGNGIQLFKAVLGGNPTDSYEKLAKKLDGESACWEGIALYIMGTTGIVIDDNDHSSLTGNVEEYMKQMNAILACDNSVFVLDKISGGAAAITLNREFVAAITPQDCALKDVAYREYKKSMIMYDTFTYLSCVVAHDKSEIPLFQRGNKRYAYEITDVSYSDAAGLTLTIDKCKEIKPQYVAIWYETDEKSTFKLEAKYVTGANNVSQAYSAAASAEDYRAAENKQRELMEKVAKDGFILGGTIIGGFAGNPVAGATIAGTIYDANVAINDREISDDMYKKYIDTEVKRSIDCYYKYASDGTEKWTGSDIKSYYTQASQLTYDTYKFLSYDGVEKAKNADYALYKAEMVGSAGTCVIDYDLSDDKAGSTMYCTLHSGYVAPEYATAFSDLSQPSTATEQHGLAALGNWNDEFKSRMEKYVENPPGNITISNKEVCKQLINGGYDIAEHDDSSDYKDLYNTLNELQTLYNHVEEELGPENVPQEKCNDGGEIMGLWGSQNNS